jgi:two-component system, sensor histidine kinase and response regulator
MTAVRPERLTPARSDRPLVLVVAPATLVASRIADELDALRCRALTTVDARRVVDTAASQRPDLCIIEEEGAPDGAGTPVSGLDICRQLKEDPRTARLPVLVLTAQPDAAAHARAMEAGADDALDMQRDRALLGARVRALLRLKLSTDALDESARRLRELEKVRDDLMKMIVHDLKTPLTSVLATLEMLGDGDLGRLGDVQKRAVEDMRAMGDQLLELIDDLLQVWRIESTTLALSPEVIVPANFLQEMVRDFAYRFRQEQVDVRVDVVPEARAFHGDRALLRRVFANLFENAIRHCPAPVRLRLKARDDRRGVLFTVADNGEGIAPEYHEVIFRTFHRLPRPNEAPVRGSGLGLAFCRLAVEAHGGRIWVQSEEGRGSAFHVLMPFEPGPPGHAGEPG